jgi:hypothetical protein
MRGCKKTVTPSICTFTQYGNDNLATDIERFYAQLTLFERAVSEHWSLSCTDEDTSLDNVETTEQMDMPAVPLSIQLGGP